MAEEGYEIKVGDSVSPEIANKLGKIAKEAENAHNYIQQLKAELDKAQSTSALQKLQTEIAKTALAEQKLQTEVQKTQAALASVDIALNRAVASEAKANSELAKLSINQNKASIETSKLAQEQEKINTIYLKNELALNRAIDAENRAAISLQRLSTEKEKTATAAAKAALAEQQLSLAAVNEQTAQERLTLATERVSAAQIQSSVASQRLATETERTATQAARTAAAQDRAAIASLRLQQAQLKASTSTDQMAREAEALKRKLYPLYDAQEASNAAIAQASRLWRAGAIDAKTYYDAVVISKERMQAATTAQNAINKGFIKLSSTSQLARHHLINLGYQIQDIGVSLASGQNPLTVFIQQGSQIAGIASAAGVGMGTMAKAAVEMLLPFAPLVITVGSAYGAFKLFQSEISDQTNLKAYAKELGATSNQIKKLHLDTITFTDTLKGLWATLSDRIGVGDTFDGLWESAKKTFKNILGYVALSAQSLISIMQATKDVISASFDDLPTPIKKSMATVSNVVIGFFENMVNAYIDTYNVIIKGLNTISDMKIDPFKNITFSRISTEFADTSGRSLADVFLNSYTSNLENNKAATAKFMADWAKSTEEAAKARVKKSLEEANADKLAKSNEKRALSLQKINAQLDNELSRMFKLQPLREAQSRLDKIEESLVSKKIKLTDDERNAIIQKITAIQQASEVQKQFDSIYNESVGPVKTYNAQLEASKKLLDLGAISTNQYNIAITKASETYKNTIDPMRQYNKSLQDQFDLLKLLPKQREIEQQIVTLKNNLLAKGIILNDAELSQLRQRLTLLQQLNAVSQQEQSLLSVSVEKRKTFIDQLTAINNLLKDQKSGFTKEDALTALQSTDIGKYISGTQEAINAQISQLNTMYSQIDELRKADLISEQSAANAKAKIWQDSQSLQLQTSKDFFDNLSKLSNSNNAKLAAIGKAAAITRSIINTYESATAAYSAMAGIPVVGPALGAAAAAAAIAAGMANVEQIRTQSTATGFFTGGYTGGSSITDITGVVHGKEFVMNAAATNRIGVANLQALQSGAAHVQNNTYVNTKNQSINTNTANRSNAKNEPTKNDVKIINVIDPSLVGDYLASPAGERVFLNTIKNNSEIVRGIISK